MQYGLDEEPRILLVNPVNLMKRCDIQGRGNCSRWTVVTYSFCPKCSSPLETIEIDGCKRRGCSDDSCDFIYWNNPIPIVAGLVEHEDGVILVRNKGWPEKWWGLVSGFLEAKETPEDGMLREIREELGLEAKIVGLIGLYPFSEMNQLIVAYHAVAKGDIELGDELEGYKIVPTHKLRPWPMGTGQAVKDWIVTRNKERT